MVWISSNDCDALEWDKENGRAYDFSNLHGSHTSKSSFNVIGRLHLLTRVLTTSEDGCSRHVCQISLDISILTLILTFGNL